MDAAGEVRGVRIVVAGPPKTGNMWLKCLLGAVYGLEWLKEDQTPARAEGFIPWAATGAFRDGTIFHRHYDYSPALVDAIEGAGAKVVTIVRDPYDAFVSQFFTTQEQANNPNLLARREGYFDRPRQVLLGKPIDHPDVVAFLAAGRFKGHLKKGNDWIHGGRTAVVRYEALKADTAGELRRLAEWFGPVADERIVAAVETCSVENMRRMGKHRAKHVRKGTVGDSTNHLTAEHLAVFRDTYGDLIRRLGYEVR
jgi:hypothetical protein